MKRYLKSRLIALLALVSMAALAATSDCEDMEVDGTVQCIEPSYTPDSFSVCDEHMPSVGYANAWAACGGTTGSSEGAVMALAICFDNAVSTGSPKGDVGAPVWGADRTYSGDGWLCWGGVNHIYNGHVIQQYATSNSTFGGYGWVRSSAPICPTGYEKVTMNISGRDEVVKCKPCGGAGSEWNAAKNACVQVIIAPLCETCEMLTPTSH